MVDAGLPIWNPAELPKSASMFEFAHTNSLPILSAPMRRLEQDPLRELLALERQFGEVCCWDDDPYRLWFVFGPKLNRVVLSETETYHSCFCPIRGPRNSSQRRLTGGLLNMNGDEHRRHRRLLSAPFQRPAIAGYYAAVVALAQEMLDGWSVGQVRDVREDMDQFMLKITSAMLFGVEDSELANRTGTLLDEFLTRNNEVGLAAVGAQSQRGESYSELLTSAELVEEQVRRVIDWRRRSGSRGNDLLSLLLEANDAEGSISDADLVGHTALLFGAAKSTTSFTLTWTLLLVALHAAVSRELERESRAVLDGRTPTLDDPDRLPYLDCVIKESMRILPASAYVQRVTSRPTSLGPFSLDRGATVVFSQFVSHRIPQQFPEPDRFQPERWQNWKPAAYAYIPFGMGARLCLGTTLAMTILKFVLPMIWQRFSLEVEDNSQIDMQVVATMLSPAGPVPMRLHPPNRAPSASRVRGAFPEYVALA